MRGSRRSVVVAVVAVVAATLAGLGAGVAAGLLPGGDAPVPHTGVTPTPTPTVVSSPAVPAPPSGTPNAPPTADPSSDARFGPVPSAPAPGCPARPQLLAAAAAEEPGVRGAPVVITGPECAAGWAAALIGMPADGIRRLVLRRSGGGFETVVYQPTLEECPPVLARMPTELRSAVAC